MIATIRASRYRERGPYASRLAVAAGFVIASISHWSGARGAICSRSHRAGVKGTARHACLCRNPRLRRRDGLAVCARYRRTRPFSRCPDDWSDGVVRIGVSCGTSHLWQRRRWSHRRCHYSGRRSSRRFCSRQERSTIFRVSAVMPGNDRLCAGYGGDDGNVKGPLRRRAGRAITICVVRDAALERCAHVVDDPHVGNARRSQAFSNRIACRAGSDGVRAANRPVRSAVWWAKAENIRAATLALRVRAPDFEWIQTLHPDPSRPYEWSRAMPTFSTSRFPDASESRVMPRCQGEIRLQPVEGGRFFRMSGRRVVASSGAALVLQDNIGTIQRLAEIAPVVNVPNPTYGQVISAVWHAVRRGRFHEPEWFGFALPGAGPPYRALAIEKGRAICSVSVSDL